MLVFITSVLFAPQPQSRRRIQPCSFAWLALHGRSVAAFTSGACFVSKAIAGSSWSPAFEASTRRYHVEVPRDHFFHFKTEFSFLRIHPFSVRGVSVTF